MSEQREEGGTRKREREAEVEAETETEAEAEHASGAGRSVLSAEERQLYDRQLRVWGADAQAKLKDANLLVLGACGSSSASADIAGEVLKNVTLSGVGTITLCTYRETKDDGDGDQCPQVSGGRDTMAVAMTGNASGDGMSLLEGMYKWTQKINEEDDNPDARERHDMHVETEMEGDRLMMALRDMNPLVDVRLVAHESCSEDKVFESSFISKFQSVLIFRKQFSFKFVRALSKACRECKVSCYVGEVRGEHGYFVSDLGQHHFKDDNPDKKGPEIVVEYPSIEAVLEIPKDSLPRRAPQIASALKVLSMIDDELSESDTSDIVSAALKAKQRLIDDQGFKPKCITDDVLKEFVTGEHGDPSVNAIVGGVLAQDIVRSLSHKGRPIFNFFCFSTTDDAGWVLPIATAVA